MIKQLKTLEQIKSEAYQIRDTDTGIGIYYLNDKSCYFINKEMFKYFGWKIGVKYCTNNKIYEYTIINDNEQNWNFTKKWFANELFSDEDFMI